MSKERVKIKDKWVKDLEPIESQDGQVKTNPEAHGKKVTKM